MRVLPFKICTLGSPGPTNVLLGLYIITRICVFQYNLAIIICYCTVLGAVSRIDQDERTDTTYRVTWIAARGNLDGYIVECICNESITARECVNHISRELSVPALKYKCSNLTAGSKYYTNIRTVRRGWVDHVEVSAEETQTCKCDLNPYLYISP